jgi:predicted MFS family arabinose efflux permease
MAEPPPEQAESVPQTNTTQVGTSAVPLVTGARGAFALIGMLLLVRFLQVGGIAAPTTFFNVYMDQVFKVDAATIGAFASAAKLLGIPLALFIPLLTRCFGHIPVTLAASLAVFVAILPMIFAPNWWAVGLGYVGVWLVTPVRYAAFMVFSLERTPQHLRSTMNGAQEMSAGLSFALISFTGGAVIDALGYAPVFILGAALALIGMLVLLLYAGRSPRVAAPAITMEKLKS